MPFLYGVNAIAVIGVGAARDVSPGNKIEVPIELLSSADLIPSGADHYKGTLRYNGTMLVPSGSSGGTIGTSSAAVGNTDRSIGFEGNSSPMIAGTLQKIQFDVMLGNDTCTPLIIDTFYWTDADVDVSRQNGVFCESGICFSGGGLRLINGSGKFSMSPIHPNPSSSHIIIEYDLQETGRTGLILSDALGRSVRIIKDEDKKPGHYRENISLEEISSGYYRVLLKTPSQFLLQSFIVQK